APARQRAFGTRYDALVADGLAANPNPPSGRRRTSLQRQSFNLATAFDNHRQAILRYMYDLDVSFTNNQAERDLRPVKIHRKISSCFRSQAGAERFAHVRSYLSTTRKNDVGALDALTCLFNGDPWMPPQAA
ncbi:MAG: transposase, partial [Actinobacteria bacterium]|nr:transposase [Actinomycetota bacterium]